MKITKITFDGVPFEVDSFSLDGERLTVNVLNADLRAEIDVEIETDSSETMLKEVYVSCEKIKTATQLNRSVELFHKEATR